MDKPRPCPFCQDPMDLSERSGIIRHTFKARNKGQCPIVHEGFTSLARWNTRTPPQQSEKEADRG